MYMYMYKVDKPQTALYRFTDKVFCSGENYCIPVFYHDSFWNCQINYFIVHYVNQYEKKLEDDIHVSFV